MRHAGYEVHEIAALNGEPDIVQHPPRAERMAKPGDLERRCGRDCRRNRRDRLVKHARHRHGASTMPHGDCPTGTDFSTFKFGTSITDISLLMPLAVYSRC